MFRTSLCSKDFASHLITNTIDNIVLQPSYWPALLARSNRLQSLRVVSLTAKAYSIVDWTIALPLFEAIGRNLTAIHFPDICSGERQLSVVELLNRSILEDISFGWRSDVTPCPLIVSLCKTPLPKLKRITFSAHIEDFGLLVNATSQLEQIVLTHLVAPPVETDGYRAFCAAIAASFGLLLKKNQATLRQVALEGNSMPLIAASLRLNSPETETSLLKLVRVVELFLAPLRLFQNINCGPSWAPLFASASAAEDFESGFDAFFGHLSPLGKVRAVKTIIMASPLNGPLGGMGNEDPRLVTVLQQIVEQLLPRLNETEKADDVCLWVYEALYRLVLPFWQLPGPRPGRWRSRAAAALERNPSLSAWEGGVVPRTIIVDALASVMVARHSGLIRRIMDGTIQVDLDFPPNAANILLHPDLDLSVFYNPSHSSRLFPLTMHCSYSRVTGPVEVPLGLFDRLYQIFELAYSNGVKIESSDFSLPRILQFAPADRCSEFLRFFVSIVTGYWTSHSNPFTTEFVGTLYAKSGGTNTLLFQVLQWTLDANQKTDVIQRVINSKFSLAVWEHALSLAIEQPADMEQIVRNTLLLFPAQASRPQAQHTSLTTSVSLVSSLLAAPQEEPVAGVDREAVADRFWKLAAELGSKSSSSS